MSATPEEWDRIENPEPPDDPYAGWDYEHLGIPDEEFAEVQAALELDDLVNYFEDLAA